MTDTQPTEPEVTTGLTREKALQQAYSTATAKLREKYLTEFNKIRVAETKALGYEWTPPPTEEEKALAEVKDLLAKHPGIAEKVAEDLVSRGK